MNNKFSKSATISMYKLIQSHTTVTSVNDIQLHLITPKNPLYYCRDEKELPFPEPWWAFCWPGGKFLAKYILDSPSLFKNKSVIDIGSGCGICSIAAAKAGASHVLANDIDPFASTALDLNIALNSSCHNNTVEFLLENKIPQCEQDIQNAKIFFSSFDIVICGDMLYDTSLSTSILRVLEDHPNVLFGDPGRLGCPKDILNNSDSTAQFHADELIDRKANRLIAMYPYAEDGFSSVKIFKLNN